MFQTCVPLSADEDTFELQSVQSELEAVEKLIQDLLERQIWLKSVKHLLF